jgi:hypothetical protein
MEIDDKIVAFLKPNKIKVIAFLLLTFLSFPGSLFFPLYFFSILNLPGSYLSRLLLGYYNPLIVFPVNILVQYLIVCLLVFVFRKVRA